MHILFFNRSFYPDTTATGQLLTDLCEDLIRDHGCRVSVVTGPPLQPSAASRRTDRLLVSHETYRGIEIHRVGGTTFDKARFAGRATNYATYFLSACYAGLRVDHPAIVVALTDPPIIGLAAWMAAKRFRAPLVMAFQDLFPEVAALLPDFHSDIINGMLQRVNRFLVRRSAVNVALGSTMRARLIDDKGAPPDRTVIIPSWADTTAIVPGPKANGFAHAHGLADSFVVMHTGNIGLSQGLETVVQTAALLRDTPDILFVFQGDGVMKPRLERDAQDLGLANIRFLPYAPKERLGESLAAADLFIVSLQRGMAGYIVPSKLYSILASGRPYVAAVEESCEVAAITRRYECGAIATPGNAQALAAAILKLYHDGPLLARLGVNARIAAAEFDRKVQVREYATLFQSLVPQAASCPGPVAV